MSKGTLITSWVAALVAAAIYIQTLFFKFTAAEESVSLFTKLAGESEALMRRVLWQRKSKHRLTIAR